MNNVIRRRIRRCRHARNRSGPLLPVLAAVCMLFAWTCACAAAELSLREALVRSRDHSRAIRAAHHDSTAAAFNYRRARSAYFPTLSLQATSFYKDELQSIDIPPNGLEIGSHENYQADVRLTVPLYTGGRIARRTGIERERERSVASDLQAERLRTARECRRAYFGLVTAQSMERAAEASLERVHIIEKDVQHLFSAGMADSIDILDVRLAVRDAGQALEEKRNLRLNAEAVLARVIGAPPDERLRVAGRLPDPSPPARAGEPPAESALERPELRALDGRVRAAELAMRLNRAGYLPVVSLFGSYTAGKPNQDLFHKEWNDYFSGGVSLSWEFNTGGDVGYAVDAARETALAAKMRRGELEEALVLNARIALNDCALAYEVFAVSREKYEIARDKFRLARGMQAAGGMSVNRLLELEAELSMIEEQYAASRSNYYIAETDVLYATGSDKIFGGLSL